MSNYLILGATSAVAQKFTDLIIQAGHKVVLVARNPIKLKSLSDHYNTISPGSVIDQLSIDLSEVSTHQQISNHLSDWKIESTLMAYGVLGNDSKAQGEVEDALHIIHTNFTSYVSLLTHLHNYYLTKKMGTIAVITSVAGDRGRQSNYVYGSSKGALSIYLSGLQNKLYHHGVQVLDIKPGFIDTPMTVDFKKGILWAKPEVIAQDIYRAIQKNKYHLYTPFFWRYIMMIIKSIPLTIFKRLKI